MNFINNITGKYQVLLEEMFINNLFIRVTLWLDSRFSGHQAHKQQLLFFAAIIKPFLFSTVTGQPFDDPKGRWRVGGGIDVPLDVKFKAHKTQATEIKRILSKTGIQAKLKNDDDGKKK